MRVSQLCCNVKPKNQKLNKQSLLFIETIINCNEIAYLHV